jgi:hypothetical protein
MDKSREIENILKEHGAVFHRRKKHLVWRFPDGKIFIQASTASDERSVANNLGDLKKLLGLQSEHKEGVRRLKTRTAGRSEQSFTRHSSRSPNTSLADQLKAVGIGQRAKFEERIETLERQLELALEEKPESWSDLIAGIKRKVWK